MGDKVVVTKLGSEPPAPKTAGTQRVIHKSILKTSNPTKSPPVKKSMLKHTIRLLTDKGSKRHRKTLRHKIAKMSDEKIKDIASRSGLLKNKNTPISVLRQMVEGGAVAGFLSV
jgi:predicted type IV restriction endonuclease